MAWTTLWYDTESFDLYFVKVHEIKFDAYGIMDDGLDDSTDVQLARAAAENGGAAAASAAIEVDEDLFDDEDLDELEEDMDKLDV